MYHDVYDHDLCESGFVRDRDLPYKIKSEIFEDHVKKISAYCSAKGLPKDYVIFTFDDGGKSFITTIAPILEKYGYRGLFFISTKFIGTETFVNEEDIIELYKRGHIIGSHAHTHVHFYTLTEAQVEEEWRLSTGMLGKIIGIPITYASIPNGDTSKCVLKNAAKYGIKHIYTSEPTTEIGSFNCMEVIGRYVLLAESSTDYTMSIITSSKKRFALSCKRTILKVIKSILGEYYVNLKNLLFR